MKVARNAALLLIVLAPLTVWLNSPAAIAQAPGASIANFDARVIGDTHGRYGAPAVTVDTDGNAIDAHDGIIRYFAGRY